MMEIGQTIKKLRKERNFTQEELAEQLNITSQAVSKWERTYTAKHIHAHTHRMPSARLSCSAVTYTAQASSL
ncbi:MAG: helix-turn-helix domain-containing protein [Oscillospiraceae bacterium]|jgi:transcriptional regulator with XRE-family HTH domain|nr:helix-turn-helix domain-containing protein [Oscillospiraceae bacterium]